MQRISKRIGIGLGGMLVLVLLAAVYFYSVSADFVAQASGQVVGPPAEPMPPLESITVPTDSATLDLGRRRARSLQCTNCHGEQLQGRDIDSHVGSNHTEARERYSNAELVRAIRYGVAADSTHLMGMLPRSFYHISDRDLAALIAHIRSVPHASNDELGPSGVPGAAEGLSTLQMVVGGFMHVAYDWTPFDTVDPKKPRRSARPGDGLVAYGRYLAQTHCARCHGADLRGEPGYWKTPDVAVGAAYTSEQFERLLREGVGASGRRLGYMTDIAPTTLRYLTDAGSRRFMPI